MSTQSTAPSNGVPSAHEFTTSPLRNRVRVELEAPVSEVWELLGDLSRFPEYSEGLERVEAVVDDDGRCVEYMCYFGRLRGGPKGPGGGAVKRWEGPTGGPRAAGGGGVGAAGTRSRPRRGPRL